MSDSRFPGAVHRAIEAHFAGDREIPADVVRLGNLAAWDLWHGPVATSGPFGPDDGQPWPGFIEATRRVAEWAAGAIPDDLYVDADCECVLRSDPAEDPTNYETLEAEADDPDAEIFYVGPESVYVLTCRDVLGVLFDYELASGGYLD